MGFSTSPAKRTKIVRKDKGRDGSFESPRSRYNPPVQATASGSRRKTWAYVAVCVLIALAIAFTIAWNNGLHDYFYPKAFRVVIPDEVFASGQINRRLIAGVISDYHIQRIISLTDDGPTQLDEVAERQTARRMGVQYFLFPLDGNGTGDITEYEKTLLEVHQAVARQSPILVHCFSGAQRTRGWIAFYRLLIQRQPPAQVEAELTNSTWKERPSRELFPYLNAHMAQVAQFLLAHHVISSIPTPLPQLNP